jgi:oligo-1,6-glucosidase
MKREVLSHYDIITVGEAPAGDRRARHRMTHGETGALNMLFQFEHMDVDRDPDTRSKWTKPAGRWSTSSRR